MCSLNSICMYDRKHIERVLKINGLTPEAGDEEIRAVLLAARYRDDEVDQAVRVLRENAALEDARDAKLVHKIMRTDSGLSASEVSKLLGIDVPVQALVTPERERLNRFTGVHVAVIAILSLLIAGIGLGLAMYAQGFGVFYNEASVSMHVAG